MLEAQHFTATATRKGTYALPDEFDGQVNTAVLYHAVRAYRNNQRQGTASTKTRSEVSGGSRKPWRQKGTGRARQGTIRAPHWAGGGIAFGPKPRGYRTDLPRKVRQSARRSALNARANDGAIYVIEDFAFEEPKTRQMVDLIAKLELVDRNVLVLTTEERRAVHLSCRNLRNAYVMRYRDAAAFHILWADALVIEESALGGHALARASRKSTARSKRAQKASATSATRKKATKKKAAKKSGQTTKSVRKKASRKKGTGNG